MTIGLISARGGSVRLPRKNIKPLCGHPLVAWTIVQMLYSKLIDYILFTTDDQEIWGVFEKYIPEELRSKCHAILRPVWDNDTAINRPYLHAIETMREQGMPISDDDLVVTLFATTPQRHPWDVDNMIQVWHESNGKYDTISWFAPDRECFIYQNNRPMQQRYGISYEVTPIITDKFWKYSVLAGGNAIYKVKTAVDAWSVSWSDRELDARMKPENYSPNIGAFSVYPYQAIECDYDHWFSVVEAVMEKMILKGRGIEIYQDYYEGHI